MRKLALVTLSVLVMYAAGAQSMGSSYRTALGVKVWDGAGISLKHFTSGNNAVEAIGYFYNRGFRLTGLYEIHGDIAGAPGLKWYIGPGAHIGFYNGSRRYDDDNDVAIGIDGVLGLDYKFRGAPINMSLDWQPAFEFGDGRGFSGSWGGLGIRYTF
ncbi:MAG: hypothetical protein ACO1NX_01790 [Chitinophagaceae bacterium]